MAANMVDSALRVGIKSFVETNCVGTAMPMSPGQTALRHYQSPRLSDGVLLNTHLSRFAPSTMIGPAMPRVALFAQPETIGEHAGVEDDIYTHLDSGP